jgi:hypothetical protein
LPSGKTDSIAVLLILKLVLVSVSYKGKAITVTGREGP